VEGEEDQEEEKMPIIAPSNAIMHPGTVVVE